MDPIQVLDMHIQQINAAVGEAQQAAADDLYENVVDRARRTPGWDMLADNIEVWSQDGQLVVGVARQDLQSLAESLEFGDETRPPSGFFRTLTNEGRSAGEAMDRSLRSNLPEKLI